MSHAVVVKPVFGDSVYSAFSDGVYRVLFINDDFVSVRLYRDSVQTLIDGYVADVLDPRDEISELEGKQYANRWYSLTHEAWLEKRRLRWFEWTKRWRLAIVDGDGLVVGKPIFERLGGTDAN